MTQSKVQRTRLFLSENKLKPETSHLRFLNNMFAVWCTAFVINLIKIVENVINSMDIIVLRGSWILLIVFKILNSTLSLFGGPNHSLTLKFMTQILQCNCTTTYYLGHKTWRNQFGKGKQKIASNALYTLGTIFERHRKSRIER